MGQKLILQRGQVNSHCNSAAEKGHIHIVKFLLDRGAGADAPARIVRFCDLSDQKNLIESVATALQYACILAFVEIALLLLEHNANVNAPGTNTLFVNRIK